ncbi:MAG TPA: hypothetical protein VF765_22005 [Polyangiaceae bacterium]
MRAGAAALAVAVAAFATATTACSSSTSGEGATEGDGGPDAAASDYCLEAGSRGDGSRFTDLYRDFFGPEGGASCSATSICHVPGGTGLKTSGYECAPDQDGCWLSMTSSIVPDGGTPMPESTGLYKALRKAPPTPGSGPMPRNSTFAFCPADLQRITTWIQNGAPND